MSIASELQNYADGLGDAYDAVNDMNGILPAQKNMNNLDAAIRTIPQPTVNDGTLTIQKNGTQVATFTANQASNATANITVPTDTSDLTNTAGFITSASLPGDMTGATGGTAGAHGLVPAPSAGDENKVLSGAGTWVAVSSGGTYTAGNGISIDANNEISIDDTVVAELSDLPSDFTGATSSIAGAHGLVPAPAAGDEGKVLHGDGTWKDATAKLVEMSYGESNAWAKFIAAYNAGSIVYCRASSNANPATGAQTRKAFMAYVNNATSPTSVEFQYVRSVSSKTDSQQCDQVFVYTLTNAGGGTWTVASRNMAPKINVSGPITKTFTTGASATVTIGADVMTGATSSAAGAAGVVPAPAAGDDTKFLAGDGTWKTAGGGGGTPESIILTDMVSMYYPDAIQWAQAHGLNPSALQSLNFPNGGCVALNDAGTEILPLDYVCGLFAQGKTILVKGVFIQYGGTQIQVGYEPYNGQVLAADTLSSTNFPFILSFAHENIIGQYPIMGLRKQATLGQISGKEYATLAKI